MLAAPMNSPRRRRDRPIESVSLKVTFSANGVKVARIREAFPSAVVRDGVCEVKVEAGEPAEVAERAKALLEKMREIG